MPSLLESLVLDFLDFCCCEDQAPVEAAMIMMKPSYLVQTPHGKAKVLRAYLKEEEKELPRPGSSDDASADGTNPKPLSSSCPRFELELLEASKSATTSVSTTDDADEAVAAAPPSRTAGAMVEQGGTWWTTEAYPSVSPTVGSHVITGCFQRPMLGRVVSVRPLDRIATLRLYDWCLLGRGVSMVTCHFSYDSLQVVDPPSDAFADKADEKEAASVSSLSSPVVSSGSSSSAFVCRILDVQEHKSRGYQLYKAHCWAAAHAEFDRTSSLIADLLVLRNNKDKTTGQGLAVMIRGNLILTCIKCSNYMAICKLWRNELAASIKHCMDALYLLRSLEVKTSRRYRDYFGKYAGEIRVFGCWRIKTLQIMAHVFLEKRQYSAAKDLLRQAHKNATRHLSIHATNPELERRLAQLSRSDRATMRLYSVVTRQLAGHDAAREASRHWLLEEVEDDAQWPPLPIDENHAEESDLWMTPTRDRTAAVTSSSGRSSGHRRRRFVRSGDGSSSSSAQNKSIDSPGTYVTEASSFETEEDQSCASEQTSDTAATYFRNLVSKNAGMSPTSVKALVPSDTNIYARDNKVFEARKNYLDTVVQKNNLSGTILSFEDSSSRRLDASNSGEAADESAVEEKSLPSVPEAVAGASTTSPSSPGIPE
jgi:hypothetical protein